MKRSIQVLERKSSILFLSPTLFPQPNASAAGVRTVELLNHFASSSDSFSQVHYGCGLRADDSQRHEMKKLLPNVHIHHFPPNREEEIKEVLHSSTFRDLKTVVFDRFFAEEAYSHYFYNHRPDVMRVLDMQDMHSLRYYRHEQIKAYDVESKGVLSLDFFKGTYASNLPTCQMDAVNKSKKKDASSMLLRELSSIHRSDLSLVCSPYELKVLSDEYLIPHSKMGLAPFFTEPKSKYYGSDYSFSKRSNFVSLGGFKHPPNIDQVLMLQRLWPRIREQIPDAKIYVYGSYPPPRIKQMHDPKKGFIVKGYVDNLDDALATSRVMLAPVRFGAGIKGKIIDSWMYGCPVVTTPIGMEGISSDDTKLWDTSVAHDDDSFIERAVSLYKVKALWDDNQRQARLILETSFGLSNLDRIDNQLKRQENL
ncbi:hypothetical protein CTEN210_06357 [Chaetoceros tenuissimus]|uniref:Glycosyltransferase n=1 Tax=Chaetoceros tenuissimus TaxID=426638 RepID=A0AAD3CRJ8_9STRA|nr:hypothetical protein CTEN210_06357 [Chaetoceros tenuissimus]